MEVSNRYGPHSGGFTLAIGEGEERNSSTPFYFDGIGTDVIEERGPVISRSVTVREGVPLWASSDWDEWDDPRLWRRTAWVLVPAMTTADLQPQKPAPTTITPATPRVVGRAAVDSTLRAVAGAWRPAGVQLAYQWLRDGAAIGGARGTAYRLTGADAGHRVSVRVTGTLATGSASRTSAAVLVLRTLTRTPRPRIDGTAAVGYRLTVRTAKWRPVKVTLQIVWYRDGHRIGQGAHYTVRQADRHHRITVVVTGTRPGYEPVARTSAARRVR